MIVLIQTVLIVAVLVFASRMLALRNTHKGGAWKKLGLILLAVATITSIVNPELTTLLANMVGIGRGADLLLYTLFMAFLLYVVTRYVSDQDKRDELFRLARRVAVIEAEQKYSKSLNKK